MTSFPRSLIVIFLVWLGLLLAVGFATRDLNPSLYAEGKCTVKNQLPFYRWDSFWYTSIARHGYTFSEEKNSSIAFFPFYPAILHGVSAIVPVRADWLSFELNILFSFAAVGILYRLARLDYREQESLSIVAVFLFFPPTYFFLSGYPDILFALLAIASFWTARLKHWGWTGILAALLAVTKPYGILILPSLFLEYWWSQGWEWRAWWRRFDWLPLLLPLATFGSFLVFNYEHFGRLFAFLDAQRTWGRSLGSPLASLLAEAQHYLFGGHITAGGNFPYLIYVVSFLFSLLAFKLSWSRVRKTYLLFAFLLLLSALLTGTLTSWGRYMLLGFPVLMGPALYLAERKRLLWAYLIFSAFSLALLAQLFVRCYPVE